jgi:hypothetical protein
MRECFRANPLLDRSLEAPWSCCGEQLRPPLLQQTETLQAVCQRSQHGETVMQLLVPLSPCNMPRWWQGHSTVAPRHYNSIRANQPAHVNASGDHSLLRTSNLLEKRTEVFWLDKKSRFASGRGIMLGDSVTLRMPKRKTLPCLVALSTPRHPYAVQTHLRTPTHACAVGPVQTHVNPAVRLRES